MGDSHRGGSEGLRGERRAVSPERWREIANSPEFARVQALRRRITVGTLGVFVLVFGTFLVLSGYARPFMRRSVDGGLTVAYVWLLALTVLAWLLVWVYLRFAERLSEMAEQTLAGTGSAGGVQRGGPRPSEGPSLEHRREDLS
jgi:uncharacterized membrane protein (DUF485 family)